jgi:hypothetical protein
MADAIVCDDHMPHVDLLSGTMSLDATRTEYFGKNTIIETFNNQGLDYKDYFFVFDSYLNLEGFDQHSVFYPKFFLKTIEKFLAYSPTYKIDFAMKKNSVNCLMHKNRSSRILASCWFANNPINDLLYTQFWSHNNHELIMHLEELLQLGNLTDWNHSYGPEYKMLKQCIDSSFNITESGYYYDQIAINFFEKIAHMYYSTVFSVTLEPVFWEHGSMLTEKYAHAVYGGTIPILNGYQVYDNLNKLGFDTFSDIIDTSSQHELDPILRIWNMLEKNKNVFAQWKEIISDVQIQKRMVNNLDLIQCPEKIFKNSLASIDKTSLQKVIDIKDSLTALRFPCLDMLNVSD